MFNGIKNNENLINFSVDLFVRLSVVEKILIEKNIVSKEEFVKFTNEVSKDFAKAVLKDAGITQNVESILSEFDKK